MCRVLSVSKSGYYIWLKRPPSKRQIENRRLEVEIEAAHRRTRGVFGPHRQSHGIKVSLYRIRRIRRNLNLRCRQIRKFKATTDSKHRFPVVDNLINQNFITDAPDKVWVTDITYTPTREGWL